jgi:hypothetical protein
MKGAINVILLILMCCQSVILSQKVISTQKLISLEGRKHLLSDIAAGKKDVAIIFFNDECPVCRYYASQLNGLDSVSQSDNIPLVCVFSGLYSPKQIRKFIKKYRIKIPVFRDPSYDFAKALGAKITPEIFLINLENDSILYKGKINDAFVSLGVRKSNIVSNYFLDAIREYVNGSTISIPETLAIGCMLNY